MKIINIIGEDLEIVSDKKRIRPEKSEVNQLVCNNQKIRKNTDWQPDYNLNKGLEETVVWLRENIDYYKPNIYNV